MTESLVYKADIISNEENSKTKVYYGLSETTFKVRYANHKKTFNYIKYKSDSELSHEFWNIKNSNNNPTITWQIFGKHKSYDLSTKRCMLCLNEKLAIALHKGDNLLNKRSEIVSKCRHKNKFSLASYDSKD